jgi:hypothetical protein
MLGSREPSIQVLNHFVVFEWLWSAVINIHKSERFSNSYPTSLYHLPSGGQFLNEAVKYPIPAEKGPLEYRTGPVSDP